MKTIGIILAEIAAINQSRKKLREFGIIFCVAGIVLAGISYYKHGIQPTAIILAAAGLLFLALGFLYPGILKPLHKIWMSLGIILGYFFTKIILFISFFVIITPMSLLLRLLGKDILDLKLSKPENTYWKDYENVTDMNRYRKMF